ncbi:MAG: hypothetical protein LBK73_10220 [Treponema sp.]|jgi:hypothetical protein|nr:hypothetical protein [Treponema sp.]
MLTEYGGEITLADFLAAYTNCGFNLDGENNFMPKLRLISTMMGNELSFNITDTAKSYDLQAVRPLPRQGQAGKP